MEEIIKKLNECFLPKNIECDGGCCSGCWKDVVRAAIKMLEQSRHPAVSGSVQDSGSPTVAEFLRSGLGFAPKCPHCGKYPDGKQ